MLREELGAFLYWLIVAIDCTGHALVHVLCDNMGVFADSRPWWYLVKPCAGGLLANEVAAVVELREGNLAAELKMGFIFIVVFLPCVRVECVVVVAATADGAAVWLYYNN